MYYIVIDKVNNDESKILYVTKNKILACRYAIDRAYNGYDCRIIKGLHRTAFIITMINKYRFFTAEDIKDMCESQENTQKELMQLYKYDSSPQDYIRSYNYYISTEPAYFKQQFCEHLVRPIYLSKEEKDDFQRI